MQCKLDWTLGSFKLKAFVDFKIPLQFMNPIFSCKALFRIEPFFTYSGTCFTTRAEVLETVTAVSSSLQIWLNLNLSNVPGTDYFFTAQIVLCKNIFCLEFNIMSMGSSATERNGALFYFSLKDHPARGLNLDPLRIGPGELQVVGLRKKMVRRPFKHTCSNQSSD